MNYFLNGQDRLSHFSWRSTSKRSTRMLHTLWSKFYLRVEGRKEGHESSSYLGTSLTTCKPRTLLLPFFEEQQKQNRIFEHVCWKCGHCYTQICQLVYQETTGTNFLFLIKNRTTVSKAWQHLPVPISCHRVGSEAHLVEQCGHYDLVDDLNLPKQREIFWCQKKKF
jgi:hypothetical protein